MIYDAKFIAILKSETERFIIPRNDLYYSKFAKDAMSVLPSLIYIQNK